MMPTSFETENDGTALMNMRKATPTPHPHHGSVLSYSQLSYTVKTKDSKKILIDDISLDVKAGHLLAIMVRNLILLRLGRVFSSWSLGSVRCW
jgi:hypothetical protein